MRHLSLLLVALCLLWGCVSQPQPADDDTTTPRRFELPRASLKDIKSREELDHYIAHFWDDFDFKDGSRIGEYDATEVYSAFAQYLFIIPQESADSLLRSLITRAEASREALDFFADMAHEVLYDPNSPMRNDEYYIPILETLLESELLDEYDKIIPQSELHMALQNRIGHPANDFTLTLSNGTHLDLYDIEADYTILLFNNPGCEMCREIIDGITASELISTLSQRLDIAIVALYPDEDIDAWRDYLPSMPKDWICAYDKELRLTSERLYDLKAIPALYLLDAEKRVIIKDGASVPQLEETLYNLTHR